MWDAFVQLNEPQLAFIAGVFGLLLSSITIISCLAAVQWRKFRQRELELAFKDDLLTRGLSAAEVDLLWSGNRLSWIQQCSRWISACWRALQDSCAKLVALCNRFSTGIRQSVSQYRASRISHDQNFKRELLDRGLTVEQIERLLAARQPTIITWLHRVLVTLILGCVKLCRTIWDWSTGRYQQLVKAPVRRDEWLCKKP